MRKQIIAAVTVLTLAAATLGGCSFSSLIPIEEEPVSTAEVPEEESESVEEEPQEESSEETVPTIEPEVTPEITPDPEPVEAIPEGMVKSNLTGLYVTEAIGKRRPVSFMTDNVTGAFPHYGNSRASVYFEAPVEADLTRECLMFEDYDDLERIGSLRSCRDYFISYVSGFDSIYCHYGQAAYAFPYLESDNVDNISGLKGYADRFFYRTHDLAAPHNAQTSGKGINEAIEYLGYRTQVKEDLEPSFKYLWVGETADVSMGEDAAYVATGYPNNKSYFVYNPDDGEYYRYQYGGPEIDGMNGEQIHIKNVILEFANATLYHDSLYVHFETTGTGKGKYITDGKAIDITWEREDFYSPAKYYRADGTPLEMTPGKTWVSVIKNKNIGVCVMGASADTASCVVPSDVQAALEQENYEWETYYKEHENEFRHELNLLLAEELAAHGGVSKCE